MVSGPAPKELANSLQTHFITSLTSVFKWVVQLINVLCSQRLAFSYIYESSNHGILRLHIINFIGLLTLYI